MEELLKSLQGKSITKKNLFDFLSEINLEELSKEKPKNTIIYDDIVIHPIKEDLVKKLSDMKTKKPEDIKKVGSFVDFISDDKNKDKVAEIDKIIGGGGEAATEA